MAAQARLSKYLFWGALVLALALYVWAFIDARETIALDERLYVLAAGVAASAVWWALIARYAEREVRRLLEVELEASRRDPYRRLSRLFHLVGRRNQP